VYAREWNGSSAGIDEDGSETGRRRVEIEMTSVGRTRMDVIFVPVLYRLIATAQSVLAYQRRHIFCNVFVAYSTQGEVTQQSVVTLLSLCCGATRRTVWS